MLVAPLRPYRPEGHVPLQLDVTDPPEPNRPAGHREQEPAPAACWNRPAAHGSQPSTAPALEKCPRVQDLQSDRDLCGWYLPAGHFVHAVGEDKPLHRSNFPGEQKPTQVYLVSALRNFPPGQSVHPFVLESAVNLPPGHL
jgi:hypothetical protein